MSFHTDSLNGERPLVDDSHAFWTIFLLAYGVLFAVAVMARTIGLHWRDFLPGAESAKSLSEGVKAAVYTFMSHII